METPDQQARRGTSINEIHVCPGLGQGVAGRFQLRQVGYGGAANDQQQTSYNRYDDDHYCPRWTL